MSKLRSISTALWSDPFIEECSPSEKLLFIYLITNEKTNMLGVYEASVKKIAFETGIDKGTVEKALKSFERLGKVKYIDNYVVLVNFLKHQRFNTNMKKSALEVYINLPEVLKIEGFTPNLNKPLESFESLSKHLGMVPKVEVEDELEDESESKEERRERVKAEFKNSLLPFLDKYGKEMLKAFFDYWSEHGPNDAKVRFEKEKSYDISKRLATWAKRERAFNPSAEPQRKKNRLEI